MIFFLFYAAFVWYLCFRYRRRWAGFACVGVGVLIVWLVAQFFHLMHHWIRAANPDRYDPHDDGRLFDFLLIVEAVMVAVVGLYLACLPRHIAVRPCRRCKYELAGLENENPTCPECGLTFAFSRVMSRDCPRCGVEAMLSARDNDCPACRPVAIEEAPFSSAATPSTTAPANP